MQVWNVLHAARWKCRMPKIAKKSPSAHHRTTLSGYIFATKARIDNRKKLVKQQYLLQRSSQYGELRPTSGWDHQVVWDTPTNFNGFRILIALLHGTVVVGVSQTLQRRTEGATYIRRAAITWGIDPHSSLHLATSYHCHWVWHYFPVNQLHPTTFTCWTVNTQNIKVSLFMVALCNRADHYIFAL